MKKSILLFAIFFSLSGFAQDRDTLKLTIREVPKPAIDTVYSFYSRVDTIALQPVKTDTSKIVKDVNKQDLDESKYRLQWKGRVKANSYYDFKGMPSTEGFLPYDIPVGEQSIDGLSSVYIGARQSRLGLEGTANTKVGTLTTYLEVDFASSTNSFLRLRHAYAEWSYFKLGHTWSTFMDNASLPNTVDFEGPNSALNKRHGVIRYERMVGEKSSLGVSIESPASDYFNPADSVLDDKRIQSNFDIATRYKYFIGSGHVQLAGISRRISYLSNDHMSQLVGWGALLSSSFYITKNHQVYAQFSMGEGIANYYIGFSGKMLDAVYNPNNQQMELKKIIGWFASYTYALNNKIKFSITGGESFLETMAYEDDDVFRSSTYFAGNIFYDPIETISLGVEVTSGARVNKDNNSGQATRIAMSASFDF